jgi:hypothetical protein
MKKANLRTLRIFGLSPETTDKKLMKRVRKLGVVEDIKIIREEDAEIPVWPKGNMALVTMATTKDAAKVITTFDQKSLHDKVYYFSLFRISKHILVNTFLEFILILNFLLMCINFVLILL